MTVDGKQGQKSRSAGVVGDKGEVYIVVFLSAVS
ncbi:hypothetical protein ACLB1M_23595 [Escherichia coli]